MSTALATNTSLVSKFADRFGVDSNKLLGTLKATAFKQSGDKDITNEQMMALLVVADQYSLNPFTKEIYAFEDKHKGIVPVVSVDGWARIINEHPMLDGIEFRYAENVVTLADGKPCPEWCEAVITRKDRAQPIVVREYLDEVYQPKRNGYAGPWQSHTKRMLRHKALIQGSRIAFGFAGIHDEDEASRIIEGEAVRVHRNPRSADIADLQQRLRARAALAFDPPAVDTATGEVLMDSATLRGRFYAATSVEALDEAAADIDLLPEDEADAAHALYLQLRADLGAKA